jgi:hypothetical protein
VDGVSGTIVAQLSPVKVGASVKSSLSSATGVGFGTKSALISKRATRTFGA